VDRRDPNLYTLVCQLLGPGRQGRCTPPPSRSASARSRSSDKQILVNGERILVKGTNRAETDPNTGRHVTRRRSATTSS
jgi:beta-galactosidase